MKTAAKTIRLENLRDRDYTAALHAIDRFEGDFDLLPFAAGIRYGEVSLYPTSEDFQNFACTCSRERRPEACWQLDAVRWRRSEGYGRPLNDGLKAIAVATAVAIRRMQHEDR